MIHSQGRWTSCHRTQRVSSYGKWRLHVFYVRTLGFNYHLWEQGFSPCDSISTSTVQKNGFTVERFFSEFSSFLEELTVTSYQFLLCGDFNFHVDDNGNANAKQFHDLLFSADLKQHVNGPTHRLGHTLDLLITREMDTLISHTGILPDPLSDH